MSSDRVEQEPRLELFTSETELPQDIALPHLPLSAQANTCLELLRPLHDCVLVFADVEIPAHRAKLTEVSAVLGCGLISHRV